MKIQVTLGNTANWFSDYTIASPWWFAEKQLEIPESEQTNREMKRLRLCVCFAICEVNGLSNSTEDCEWWEISRPSKATGNRQFRPGNPSEVPTSSHGLALIFLGLSPRILFLKGMWMPPGGLSGEMKTHVSYFLFLIPVSWILHFLKKTGDSKELYKDSSTPTLAYPLPSSSQSVVIVTGQTNSKQRHSWIQELGGTARGAVDFILLR